MARLLIASFSVISFMVFAMISLRWHAPAIEAQLVRQARAALSKADLDWAQVDIDGRELRLYGDAPGAQARASAIQALRNIPGLRSITNATQAPYELRLLIKPDVYLLGGDVVDETARADLLTRARIVAGTRDIEDNLIVEPLAPESWPRILGTLQARLSRYEWADARLSRGRLTIRGATLQNPASEQALLAAMVPAGLTGDIVLTPVDPDAVSRCNNRLVETMADQRINFEVGLAEISDDSLSVLNRVARVLNEGCGGLSIEVAGFTDSQGNIGKNLRISRERAAAVREYLAAGGVDPERLIARGFGSSRPVADNSTTAGRASNRRIEFFVLGDTQ